MKLIFKLFFANLGILVPFVCWYVTISWSTIISEISDTNKLQTLIDDLFFALRLCAAGTAFIALPALWRAKTTNNYSHRFLMCQIMMCCLILSCLWGLYFFVSTGSFVIFILTFIFAVSVSVSAGLNAGSLYWHLNNSNEEKHLKNLVFYTILYNLVVVVYLCIKTSLISD